MPDTVASPGESGVSMAPFDHPKADIILRSSDGVDFRMFKLLLSLSSPFFDSMFELPQPCEDVLPLLDVTEPSTTLRPLLSLCFPLAANITPITFKTLEELQPVLEASVKYDMSAITTHLLTHLISPTFLQTQPLAVYAIACRYKLTPQARLAAKATLRQPPPGSPLCPFTNHLDNIPATSLFRLLEYRHRCTEIASSVPFGTKWMPLTYVWFNCSHCPPGKRLRSWAWEGDDDFECRYPRQWWEEFMEVASGELGKRPCGETVTGPPPSSSSSDGEAEGVDGSVGNGFTYLGARGSEVGNGSGMPVWVKRFVARAMECPTCRTNVQDDMRRFLKLFERQVDRAVGIVELKVDF
ncbi:hypothetical protein JAAARDRAFT_199521 [Jaapia argillacea MUCL 33604]|uniref:BTB domain-containing protein n=1 Tax=Jaapia argillacea MUCL 33604 TaxID=933084 RepID=A0A067P8A6_9AGAM|nr:hypothetical protein JAAARDRAFT_199521 [Jaapia argillacea MUCL 33604]